jgi:methyl-accepting chemotaxis protein-1 (serine sensor receptor)
VAHAFNKFADKISDVIVKVRGSSVSILTGSGQVSSGNINLSQRTEEQASSLEETASSMEEMTSTVKQNADNANQASQLAQTARDQAEAGGKVVSQAVTAMGEINQSSSKIADIISVVEEIAFQTNLLALNAAVEAARAGEQGRGFAVVASEVRVLAGRSADAAKEIKNLIEDSVEKVKAGSELVDKSGETLQQIVIGVKKVTDIVFEIAAASSEQSAGIDQVNKAITQMDEMTQQNAALVEESSSASRSMQDQAGKLNELIGFFKVDESGSTNYVSSQPTTVEYTPTTQASERALLSDRTQGSVQGIHDKKNAPRTRKAVGEGWEDF